MDTLNNFKNPLMMGVLGFIALMMGVVGIANSDTTFAHTPTTGERDFTNEVLTHFWVDEEQEICAAFTHTHNDTDGGGGYSYGREIVRQTSAENCRNSGNTTIKISVVVEHTHEPTPTPRYQSKFGSLCYWTGSHNKERNSRVCTRTQIGWEPYVPTRQHEYPYPDYDYPK